MGSLGVPTPGVGALEGSNGGPLMCLCDSLSCLSSLSGDMDIMLDKVDLSSTKDRDDLVTGYYLSGSLI